MVNRKSFLRGLLVVVLVLSLALSGSACQKEANTSVMIASVSTIENSSTDEPLHTQYINYVQQLLQNGDQLAGIGLTVQARFFYSFAGASMSAFRFTLDQLLALNGGNLSAVASDSGPDSASADSVLEAGSLQDWDTIAAVNFACPFPYYFESLIWQFKGEQDKADSCFNNAWINPYFPREGIDFSYLENYSADKLEALKKEAVTLENSIYGIYGGGISPIERNPMNFSDQYLRTLAEESLKQYPDNYDRAMMFYATALQVNPFETKNFTALAILALYAGDLDTAYDCVNEGLWINKDDEALNKLAEALQQAGKEVP